MSKGGDQAVNFLIGIVLARILSPEDFGVFAIVMIFIGLAITFVDVGLGAALIQRKKVDSLDSSSVFCANLALSLVLMGVIWFLSPTIAQFYAMPELMDLIRYSSIAVLFTALGRVHRAMLMRELEFSKLFKITFPATVASGCIGIYLAMNGWGVWALIARVVLQQGLISVMLTLKSNACIEANCSLERLRDLLPFGSRIAFAGILNRGFSEVYTLVISRSYSVVDVAFYQRAKSLRALGAQNLSRVFEQALFPAYASIQDDAIRLRRVFEDSLFKVTFLSCLVMGVLGGLAEPLVLFLLGDEWRLAAPYLQIMCISGALYPVHAANLSLLKATGRAEIFLRLELIKKTVALLILILTMHHGVFMIIWGQVLSSFIALWINTYYNRKLFDIRYSFQLSVVATGLLCGSLVGGFTWGAETLSPQISLVRLMLGGVGALIAGSTVLIFFRTRLKREIDFGVALIKRSSVPFTCLFSKK
jgi:O-antigen/teichoic acid export membrane protein